MIKCFFCGKEYIPKNSRTKYCSIRCRSRDYYKKYYDHFTWKKLRKCKYCLVEFIPEVFNQEYCSFLHSKYMWRKRHYKKYREAENKRARDKTYKPEQKDCLFCKNQYWTNKMNPYQKYCTLKCARKVYYPPKKRQMDRLKYRQNHLEEIKRKDNNYKARIRFGAVSKTLNKQVVRKRDNEICRLCQKPYQVIHHILYSGKPEDLVCLCRACHASIHQRITKPPYWVGEWNF